MENDDSAATIADNFEPAQFEIELDLAEPDGLGDVLWQTGRAVRREHEGTSTWKRLLCQSVRAVHDAGDELAGAIFELQCGHAIEFDWGWEGAVAFRPVQLALGEESTDDFVDDLDAPASDSILWQGEIVSVDAMKGRVFVCTTDPAHPPTSGSFYVRPYDFLSTLRRLFDADYDRGFDRIRDLLPGRLAAARGGVHPSVGGASDVGLAHLNDWWSHAWCHLWGPPGTGKTYTTGRQVAAILDDPSERVLVVSTTNKATDVAAISIGDAAREMDRPELEDEQLVRIGKGATLSEFERHGLQFMLSCTEAEALEDIETLSRQIQTADSEEEQAWIQVRINEVRESMIDLAARNFLDDQNRVVVATAFRAITFLMSEDVRNPLEHGFTPFTTVVIDEAGLISRAATAALSLLASRRVVLAGDSKQLAPISTVHRVLPHDQRRWLASSGLSHLEQLDGHPAGVHVMTEQHRMHPDVSRVVSAYQYDGALTTAETVLSREADAGEILSGQPRAIWYVLDEDTRERRDLRADRGPGGRSWKRRASTDVVQKLIQDPQFRDAHGLFISPFVAQAKSIGESFAREGLENWTASTVHSQQGAEADVVLFDTVRASSTGWPTEEWKRLVNVALSRAKQTVIVLASRAEMNEVYLAPLRSTLTPLIYKKRGDEFFWKSVTADDTYQPPRDVRVSDDPDSLGSQLADRKLQRPVFSYEQEQLCQRSLDGKPRLVRGVAGSGKTAVLANWCAQALRALIDQPSDADRSLDNDSRQIWVVFANKSLGPLIQDAIQEAWDAEGRRLGDTRQLPWDQLAFTHVLDLLKSLLPDVGIRFAGYSAKEKWDYDKMAADYLARVDVDSIPARCEALFLDEAQDMGPSTLKLLTALVRSTDPEDRKSRSVNIFYDNAQNIYNRGTPTWSELGLDMRGRSTVMKESFRSTRPITELALNTLYRLVPPHGDDHRELVERRLIEQTQRDGEDWWQVRFNQVNGPSPTLELFESREAEFEFIAKEIREFIESGVEPGDIVIVYNNQWVAKKLSDHVAAALKPLGVEYSIQKSQKFERDAQTVIATTSHSFKGHDAEVILIPSVDQYQAKFDGEAKPLAQNLYVAMTRARSKLRLYGHATDGDEKGRLILDTVETCLDLLVEPPEIDSALSVADKLQDLVETVGHEHRDWLHNLAKNHKLDREPLIVDGRVVAEPLFTFQHNDQTFACFGDTPRKRRIRDRLADQRIQILAIGDELRSA